MHSILHSSSDAHVHLACPSQGVGNDDQKVLVLAATNTPYSLDQVGTPMANIGAITRDMT